MRIVIASVPKEEIRAKQCGDWMYDKDGRLTILVAEELDEKYQALVATHELWEALLCTEHGVDQDDVTAFDEAFVDISKGNDEAGDQQAAPYYNEHQDATKVEKLCAKLYGVVWKKYDEAVNALWNG